LRATQFIITTIDGNARKPGRKRGALLRPIGFKREIGFGKSLLGNLFNLFRALEEFSRDTRNSGFVPLKDLFKGIFITFANRLNEGIIGYFIAYACA
jgi:hypothetical protein